MMGTYLLLKLIGGEDLKAQWCRRKHGHNHLGREALFPGARKKGSAQNKGGLGRKRFIVSLKRRYRSEERRKNRIP